MSGPSILGGGRGGILNSAPSLLENGRAAFSGIRGAPGMSARSRAQLEGFYNGATALFNQLYAKTESSELQNVNTVLALRSKYSYLVSEEVKEMTASQTNGKNVDTTA